jgi:hypothetical protein
VLVWRSRAVRQAQPFSHSDLSCVTRGRGVRARGMGSVPDSAAPGLGRGGKLLFAALWLCGIFRQECKDIPAAG